ncbi:MAG: GNAT family N-acetyltransferase [Actinomyces sp.]|nr:GNAT family N-acetyltransferase [Actinomyces sp.]
MTITLTPLDVRGQDRAELVAFLTRNRFPFHVNPHPDVQDVQARIDQGAYDSDGSAALWIDDDSRGRLGLVILEDLDEDAPLFDLRLGTSSRRKGLGVPVLKAITDHVFSTMPEVQRFEGQTREDNVAMRQVFVRCGYVKEAHYRDGWPVEGGAPRASVAYAILRRDWVLGTTTPVQFDDLGY